MVLDLFSLILVVFNYHLKLDMFLNHNLIAYFVLYVQRLPTSLKILTNEEMKDFLFVYFHKYFKSKRKKMYFQVSKEKFLRKVAESFDSS